MPYDCFISYASHDRVIAERINKLLMAAGFNVWFDQSRLGAGCDWHAQIRRYCENSRVVLPILTPRWRESTWTRFETYGAEAIIPLICEGALQDVMTPPLERFQAETVIFENLDDASSESLFVALRRLLANPMPAERARLVNLRYRANDDFVGRDEDLIRLHEELHRKPDVGLTQGRVRAITAMGGIGKTTLARQYAEKFWRCYPQIFWVDSRRGLNAEFATLHDLIFPDRANIGLTRNDKARRAISELQSDVTRLLIIDNAEDEQSMSEWIPKTGACHTIITSRFSGWSAAVKSIHISALPKSVAVEFLKRRVDRNVRGDELTACNEIADCLEGLPLALETAAAFIIKSKIGFRKYVEYFDASAVKLLSLKALGSTEYQDAVITSLQPSLDCLTPGARAILQIASVVAATPLHEDQLTAEPGIILERARQLADPEKVPDQPIPELWIHEEIATLVDYSLVDFDGGFLSLHPLMLTVQFETQSNDDRQLNWRVAARLLLASAPPPAWKTDSREHWSVDHATNWERIIPHVDRMLLVKEKIPGLRAHAEFDLLAVNAYASQDSYDRALSMCRTVVLHELTDLAPEQQELQIEAKDCLACLLMKNGENQEALLVFEALADIQAERRGENHRGTLRALHNQACCLELLGRDEDAEQLLADVRERRKKYLGDDHYDSIVSIHDTGWLLRRRSDRLDEAEVCLRQSMGRWITTLGVASPDSRDAASNLAHVMTDLGRHDEAVECQQALLDGTQEALGENHLDCFSVMHNLALFEFNAGLIDESHDRISTVVDGYRRFLPPNHRDMLTAIQDLGTICGRRKDFETAEELLLEALAGYEADAGSNPRDTLRTVNNLASLYDVMDRPEEARVYHKRGIEFVRDKENPEPLELRECAHASLKLGEYELANDLLERVLAAGFELPGTSCHLARVLILLDRHEEARKHVDNAWTKSGDGGCPSYVISRILFLQILFVYVDRARPTPYLKRLREHFGDLGACYPWDVDELISKIQAMIEPSHYPFVTALASAISDKDQLAQLESFPAWEQLAAREGDDSSS